MLPNIHTEKLADYIDVFCETNYFSVKELDKILNAGHKYNLKPKVHVNQFTSIGGIKKAIEHNAVSVDHLEVVKKKIMMPSRILLLLQHYFPPAHFL